jgi:choline dehydrogenase-like flavoprotein
MGEACRKFDTPVTGGNVSFYNQNPDGAVYPTPTIGMVGLIENVDDKMTMNFRNEGDIIFLIGKSSGDINSSEYLQKVKGVNYSPAPEFDLDTEFGMQQKVNSHYKDRRMLMGRCANLTKAGEIQLQQGREQCQARNLCQRGCPYGGYFSSNSSTLPWAQNTGNLTLRPDSVVHSIIFDEQKQKATGVRVIDAKTKQATEYFARIIFVNAACLNSNLILLNSTSNRFPNGLGNDHDILGRYIAFQNYRGSLNATIDGFLDQYYYGRRPVSPLMPCFRNVYKQETDFLRGYLVFWGAFRNTGSENGGHGICADYKDGLSEAGEWGVCMSMQGEVIPKHENHLRLSKELKDEWGIPQLITAVDYDDNDEKMLKDFLTQGAEILDVAGCKSIVQNDSKQAPGLDIHEMGGVRMGKDPATSMLNKWNQLHACNNVFVTDGACMTSVGNQNPSLTFMALSARAANRAVEELKKENL